jgi:hypothetical protein
MPDTLGPINPAGDFPGLKSPGSDIASAATINFQTAAEKGVRHRITGTTQISSVTLVEGNRAEGLFAASLTLVHSANLILPGGANIVTQPGDLAEFIGEAGSVVRVKYHPADGSTPAVLPVAKGGTGATTAAAARTGLGLGSAATRNVGVSGGVPELDSAGRIVARTAALQGSQLEISTTTLNDGEMAVARRSTSVGRNRLIFGNPDGSGDALQAGAEWNGFFSTTSPNTIGTIRANQTVLEMDPFLRLAAPQNAIVQVEGMLWVITGVANTGQGGTIPTITMRLAGLDQGFVGIVEVLTNAPATLNAWASTGVQVMRLSSSTAPQFTLPEAPLNGTTRMLVRITGLGRTHATNRSVVGVEWAQSIADATGANVLRNSWLRVDPLQSIRPELMSATVSNTTPTAADTIFANVRFVAEGSQAISYQWRVNGTNIIGATTRTFSLAGRTAGDLVDCVVSSAHIDLSTPATATSNQATVQ